MTNTERAAVIHANSTAFVFVPNVCNASCDFCYVRPKLAQLARASSAVLARAETAAEALRVVGMSEVRLTGGEPTIIENLADVVTHFTDRGMRYRILSNAIDIDRHLDFFEACPPQRFTISVHSTRDPKSFFGVPVSTSKLARNRRRLAAICDVEATLVVERPDDCSSTLHASLEDLAQDGVKHVKVILENSRQTQSAAFTESMRRLSLTWSNQFSSFRYTDPRQVSCKLSQKAFPSIDLGSGRAYACCVQVGDRYVPDGLVTTLPRSADAAARRLTLLLRDSMKVKKDNRPCSEGTSFCPLSLTQ